MISYLRCPYCGGQEAQSGKRLPKTVGKYRVKHIQNINVLVLQCQKCLGTFRMSIRGSILKWEDMTHAEKSAFRRVRWVKKKQKQGE